MRICSRIGKLCLIVFCVCLSIIYLIFKPNVLIIVSNEHQMSYQSFIEISNVTKQVDVNSVTPKWTVLSDGSVIHLGNFSEELFKNIHFVINDLNICEHFSPHSLKFIIFVESEANNFERREAIRETWAQRSLQKQLNFKIVFLLGLYHSKDLKTEVQRRIEDESHRSGDIIQIDVIESFKNLTIKSVASLQWFLNFCKNADFYFKTDDDIPIHAINLIKTLSDHKNSDLSDNSIVCHKNRNRKIIRSFEMVSQVMRSYRHSIRRHPNVNRLETIKQLKEKILKYKISYSQLPGMYFPQYCSGFGYGFSSAVAQHLYEKALTIQYFMIEDVFITGFCRQKANIDIKDTKHLTLRPIVNLSDGICAFTDGRINANEMSVEDIRLLWTQFSSGKRCAKN